MVAYSLRDRAVEGVGVMTTVPSGSDEVSIRASPPWPGSVICQDPR